MKTPVPEKPAALTKSVASLIATGEPIKVPKSNPDMLDWEGEFSVVIGRTCHAVKAAQALDYVAGYTLVNDVSARDGTPFTADDVLFSVQRASQPTSQSALSHTIRGPE